MEWGDRVKLILMRFDTVDVVYRMAGKMLELSSRVSMSEDRNGFKRAVIQSGSIIEAIQQDRGANEVAPQVQLFPSLLDSKHIALVRMGSSAGGCGRSTDGLEDARDGQDVQEFLERTGAIYSLPVIGVAAADSMFLGGVAEFRSCNGRSGAGLSGGAAFCGGVGLNGGAALSREAELSAGPGSPSPDRFVIASYSDNPFVWIRAGYFLEKIHRFARNRVRCKLLDDDEREQLQGRSNHLSQQFSHQTEPQNNGFRSTIPQDTIPQIYVELEARLAIKPNLQPRGKRPVKSTNPVS